jgi:hypothetical protein
MISNALLSPADSCNYRLEPLGIRRTPGTMAKMRCAGIGPEFARIPRSTLAAAAKRAPGLDPQRPRCLGNDHDHKITFVCGARSNSSV